MEKRIAMFGKGRDKERRFYLLQIDARWLAGSDCQGRDRARLSLVAGRCLGTANTYGESEF
jgi:hypothetical protein